MPTILGTPPTEPTLWALFDLDWTLIRPVRGALFMGHEPWVWLPGRQAALQMCRAQGYRIGVVTNQKPWPRQTMAEIQTRLTAVYQALRIIDPDVLLLAAHTESAYRKPATGFIDVLKPSIGSWFCGDAAGRPDDHSADDRNFAINAGLPFYVPEHIFGVPDVKFTANTLVIMLGAPGSGKTTWALQHGTVISSDTYQSNRAQFLEAIQAACMAHVAVVIADATNPTRARREELVLVALRTGYTPYIVHILNPGDKRNNLRSGPEKVPAVALAMYWKNFEPPAPDEPPVYEIG